MVAALVDLPRASDGRLRWVPPGQLHLTLRFLGDCDQQEVVEALADLRADPARVELGPHVETLGGRVVVVPAAGLDDLASQVVDLTADLGDPPDPRGFRGHLTLGRLRGDELPAMVGRPFEATFPAAGLVLVRSELHPDGARHCPVTLFPLG